MKSIDDAIILVESSSPSYPNGNDNAIGDRGLTHPAYGCMQIRQPACDDINARYGTHLKASDVLGRRSLSRAVFWLYMSIYCTSANLGGRIPTDEDRARIWNGGLGGLTNPLTDKYWAKVSAAMSG